MEGLAKIFLLPITLYKPRVGWQWVSVEFGKINSVQRSWGKVYRGEFYVLVKNNWRIESFVEIKDKKEINREINKESIPDKILSSYVRKIKVSANCRKYEIYFSNGCKLGLIKTKDLSGPSASDIRSSNVNLNAADFFKLRVTQCAVNQNNRSLVIDYGRLDNYKLLRGKTQINEYKRGQNTMKIGGHWHISDGDKIIVDSRKDEYNALKTKPKILMSTKVCEIENNDKSGHFMITYTNGCRLMVSNRFPAYSGWTFINIEPNYFGFVHLKKYRSNK